MVPLPFATPSSSAAPNIVPMVSSYVYLLGLYLGDGNITGNGRSFPASPNSRRAVPGHRRVRGSSPRHGRAARSGHVRNRGRAQILDAGWKDWPEIFPQHGSGKKHMRPITLAGWQRALVDEHTREFIRGLIHSDGCRVVNRFTIDLPSGRRAEYAYPRYFFSNLSSDMRGLFCEYCSRLGIR